ncbi:hypothetical protein BWQ96_01298 [Gracilariopsis chorda]|uniref:Uncharacterized protein n=1 Tax=Gracilariopsis chorda TaxID=448386 RepID=A0A2V3J3C9_9FLOR|nr:hypothetical protein BWQ96_01298 [Gracilariopsis chorda]|eukprot:PXF48956.1 hypothetical protein BWQ96_01298 [Gracilariopsis chorda]
MISIPVRSGIVNAVLEACLVLIVAPIWNNALVKITNRRTFRNARVKGNAVRIGQQLPSISRPLTLLRTRAAGNKLLLIGEIVIAIVIFWLELGVNGETQGEYNLQTRYVLNGGGFPDVAPLSNLTRLRIIKGLSSQSRSCFRQVERDTYELYGVSYTSPQNFEKDVARKYGFNQSLCLGPDNVESGVGIRFVTDYDSDVGEHDLNTSRFRPGRIPDGVEDAPLPGSCEGSLYGTNTFTVLGTYISGSRIMATAIEEDKDRFEIEIGGLVNLEYDDPNDYTILERDYGTSTCIDLNYTRMTRREFSIKVTAMNTKLDVRGLARAVIAYMNDKTPHPYPEDSGVYRPYNAVDLFTDIFFSGEIESDEDTEQVIGQFDRMQVRVRGKEREVTVLSLSATVLAAVVAVAALAGILTNAFIDNHGRDVTSVAWTLGVVRSHYENLGRCWNKTPDVTTYWVQVREGWSTHFGPIGYGHIVQAGDDVKDGDITGCNPVAG